MTAGSVNSVTVVMKNVGNAAWTNTDQYKLGSQNPVDNQTWGIHRVHFSADEIIAPGATKTFNFNVTAPSTPGTYNLKWQMVREGIEWFGQSSTNLSIVVQPTPLPTPTPPNIPTPTPTPQTSPTPRGTSRTLGSLGILELSKTPLRQRAGCNLSGGGNPFKSKPTKTDKAANMLLLGIPVFVLGGLRRKK